MLFTPTFSQRLRYLMLSPVRVFDQKGQSIIIMAFAFLGLIAMLGLALDLGLVYIERTRIKRAVDAATLAAVVELPSEENAYLRAIAYLDENGYKLRANPVNPALNPVGNPQVNIWVRGCTHGSYFSSTAGNFRNYYKGNPALTPLPAGVVTNTLYGDSEYFYLYFPPNGARVAKPVAEFFIDTRTFQGTYENAGGNTVYIDDIQQCNLGTKALGSANKIKVDGVVPVKMNFMQFFGFGKVDVSDQAIAQNVTSLDVAIVFDMSGSMQFDTAGYGFYEPFDGSKQWYNIDNGLAYPNPSLVKRIPIDHLPTRSLSGTLIGDAGKNTGNLCWQRDSNTVGYFTVGGSSDPRRYVVIEAELYSLNTSLLAGPYREPGRGYWAVQYTNRRTVAQMMGSNWDPDTTYEVGARPILLNGTGSWVTHNPYVTWAIDNQVPFGHDYTLDETRNYPNDVPSIEYDFVTANDWQGTLSGSNDDTRIWARMQGTTTWGTGYHQFHWAVYEYSNLYGAANGNPLNATPLGSGHIEMVREIAGGSSIPYGSAYGGADGDRWRWRQLTDSATKLDLNNGTRYVLKIWAGGVGVDIDQIVIGNRNETAFTSNYGGGVSTLRPTAGSAFRQACNRCNPIYGLTVDQADCVPPKDNGANTVEFDDFDLSDPANNPLYSGYQPIRAAKEAVKRFISQMNPQFDQVGLVAYSTGTPSQGRVELRCLKKDGPNCFMGTSPVTYTEVMRALEKLPPDGSTNIAQGMLYGLEMLGVNADQKTGFNPSTCTSSTDHCSRRGSARQIMILMSDGVANVNPYTSGASTKNCYATDLYQPNVSDTAENRAKDCVMYYGEIAARNNVTIYTIGLGNGVDTKMMTDLAELPGSNGQYFAALSPAQLDGIFEAILKSVSVRLVE